MLQAKGAGNMLNDIEELARPFPGCGSWTIDSHIEKINRGLDTTACSIALPPAAVIEDARMRRKARAVVTICEYFVTKNALDYGRASLQSQRRDPISRSGIEEEFPHRRRHGRP